MTPEQFADELARAGFEPAVTVTREAGGMLGDHTHPFEAKALILSGDIRIATAASERVYQAGDVFHLAAEDNEKTASVQPAPNVLQDIASALGGLDNLASWLYWERRGSASPSPLDGASNERRAVMLKALERVEKARCK